MNDDCKVTPVDKDYDFTFDIATHPIASFMVVSLFCCGDTGKHIHADLGCVQLAE